MRRIVPRSPLSEDPREFVLAAILFTLGAVLFAGFGVTTVSGDRYSPDAVQGANLAYQVLGWGKYVAAVRLAWLGSRAALRHQVIGRRRTAFLWLPVVLLLFYGWLQWQWVGGAISAYLVRTGHGNEARPVPVLAMTLVAVAAVTLGALNALRLQRRQLRIAR